MTVPVTNHRTTGGVQQWRRSPWRAIRPAATMLLCVLCVGIGIVAELMLLFSPDFFAQAGTGIIVTYAIGIPVFVVATIAYTRVLWLTVRVLVGTAITLDSTGLALRLPSARSRFHRLPPVRETIPWRDIRGIETRDESYTTWGVGTTNRVYRMLRVDREPIVLFEDRAVNTSYANESMHTIATEIARRAGVAIQSLGTVEGKAWLLAAWGGTAPPWNASVITPARAQELKRVQQSRGMIITGAIVAAWVVWFLLRLRN